MADVLPFAGTRFHLKDGETNVTAVICPPHDVLTPENRQALHEKSPINIVRIVSGNETASDDDSNNRYARAAECYREWKQKGILQDEMRKCIYVYEQEYKLPGTRKAIKRRGFIALVKLQDYRSGKIRSHEETLVHLRNEQLRLLKTTQVNVTQPFLLFKDEEKKLDKVLDDALNPKGKPMPPTAEGADLFGVTHRIWMIHRKEPILEIHEAMKPKTLYIADGHHAYDAALAYRDEMREATGRRDGRQPYDMMMMYLHNADDPHLHIEPIHRILAKELGSDVRIDEVLEDLKEYFTITSFKVDLAHPAKAVTTIFEKIEPPKVRRPRFAMVLPNGKGYVLSLRQDVNLDEMIEEETMSAELKGLDVTLLHHYLITRAWIGNPEVELGEDDIHYTRDAVGALEMLTKRKGCVAFIMNPRTLEEMLSIAGNRELMPPYSTFFTPKLACGLVMRDHNVGFG